MICPGRALKSARVALGQAGGEPGSTGCPKWLVACRGWSAGLV